jgi:ABC-type branched-subunit amino acid transport system ATPase component/ABC-type branched-subunit amino acid transport system permease subunit
VLGAVGLLGLVLLPQVLTIGRTNLASAMFLYGILAVALVIQVGWAGEISLGHVGFLAIGVAVGGALNAHLHLDLVLTTLVAGMVGGAAALVIGLPALRIRGILVAVTSLAFAVLTSSYLLDRDRFGYLPDDITQPIVRFPLLGRVEIVSEEGFYYVCLGALCLALWLAAGLRGRFERVVVAVRDNERAAQAFGIDPARTKLQAFVASGFLAAFAGGLLVVHQRAIGQQVFAPVESLRALSMVVVGGIGSIPGALLGTVFVKATEWFDFLVPARYAFFFTFVGSGAGLVLVLMVFPSGLGTVVYRVRDRFLARVAVRHGIDSPFGPAERADEPPRSDVPRRAPAGAGEALLSVRGLDVSYGQVQVLFGVDLDVRAGGIVALLGTNGAGKSTALRAVCGLTGVGAGSICFDGADITGAAPHRVAAAGIAQVPGGKAIFPSLTVEEHLRLASGIRPASDREPAIAEVYRFFPRLEEMSARPAALLSGGQQQMLGLGMALVAAPKLLVIDELSLGLAPVIVEQLLELVRELRERGTTIVVVEQSVNVALTIADRAYFLEKGEVRFEGPTAELLDRPDVLRAVYLEGAAAGHGAPRVRRRSPKPAEAPERRALLECEGLGKAFAGNLAVHDLDLTVGEDEIVGIIGPNGAGKTTVFDLLSGFLVPSTGMIRLDGVDVTDWSPHRRARAGLARSFQDARLFSSLTVRQAIAVGLDHHAKVRDPLAAALHVPEVLDVEFALAEQVDALVELMGLGAHRHRTIGELSTGTRRMVDLACQIGIEPKVILLDEPSSGIAQREAEALGPVLRRIKEETAASLVVIEHDMPLIRSIADRMVALELGTPIAEGSPAEVLSDPLVVASYLGGGGAASARSGPALAEALT